MTAVMTVVDVQDVSSVRGRLAADRAPPVLLRDHLVVVLQGDAVLVLEPGCPTACLDAVLVLLPVRSGLLAMMLGQAGRAVDPLPVLAHDWFPTRHRFQIS